MNRVLEIALNKLRPFSDTNEWHACLSYAEVLALYDNGYRCSEHQNYNVQYCREQMKLGKNMRIQTYWTKIGKNKPHFNRINIPNK